MAQVNAEMERLRGEVRRADAARRAAQRLAEELQASLKSGVEARARERESLLEASRGFRYVQHHSQSFISKFSCVYIYVRIHKPQVLDVNNVTNPNLEILKSSPLKRRPKPQTLPIRRRAARSNALATARGEVQKEISVLKDLVLSLGGAVPEGGGGSGGKEEEVKGGEVVAGGAAAERIAALEEALCQHSRRAEEAAETEAGLRRSLVEARGEHCREAEELSGRVSELEGELERARGEGDREREGRREAEALAEQRAGEVAELQVRVCALVMETEGKSQADDKVVSLENAIEGLERRCTEAEGLAKERAEELRKSEETARESSRMESVAMGFMHTKLRDVEERLGEAHARIGRLESYESEAAHLAKRFNEASQDLAAQLEEISQLKKALKVARQQTASAAADSDFYKTLIEDRDKQLSIQNALLQDKDRQLSTLQRSRSEVQADVKEGGAAPGSKGDAKVPTERGEGDAKSPPENIGVRAGDGDADEAEKMRMMLSMEREWKCREEASLRESVSTRV